MATNEKIFATIQEVLVESLAVDPDEVEENSTLVDDLGAESIDLLEIIFNIEKKFNIHIDREELIPSSLFEDAKYCQDGKLTPDGLEVLQSKLPNADLEAFKANPLVQNISKILTVKDLVAVVESKLEQQ